MIICLVVVHHQPSVYASENCCELLFIRSLFEDRPRARFLQIKSAISCSTSRSFETPSAKSAILTSPQIMSRALAWHLASNFSGSCVESSVVFRTEDVSADCGEGEGLERDYIAIRERCFGEQENAIVKGDHLRRRACILYISHVLKEPL